MVQASDKDACNNLHLEGFQACPPRRRPQRPYKTSGPAGTLSYSTPRGGTSSARTSSDLLQLVVDRQWESTNGPSEHDGVFISCSLVVELKWLRRGWNGGVQFTYLWCCPVSAGLNTALSPKVQSVMHTHTHVYTHLKWQRHAHTGIWLHTHTYAHTNTLQPQTLCTDVACQLIREHVCESLLSNQSDPSPRDERPRFNPRFTTTADTTGFIRHHAFALHNTALWYLHPQWYWTILTCNECVSRINLNVWEENIQRK